MEGHHLIVVMLGTFATGFIAGSLKVKWDFYSKTGEFIEKYLSRFK